MAASILQLIICIRLNGRIWVIITLVWDASALLHMPLQFVFSQGMKSLVILEGTNSWPALALCPTSFDAELYSLTSL